MLSLLDRVSAKLTAFWDHVRERVRLRSLRVTAGLINWLEAKHYELAQPVFEPPSRHDRLLADRYSRNARR
jgi:hypothetical protein